jgi:hypothetical protein
MLPHNGPDFRPRADPATTTVQDGANCHREAALLEAEMAMQPTKFSSLPIVPITRSFLEPVLARPPTR